MSRLAGITFIALWVTLATGCAEPCDVGEYTPELTVGLTIAPDVLSVSPDRPASISVVVLDQCGRPHAAGSQVILAGLDADGQPQGHFGGTEEAQEVLFLDSTGGATSSFLCSEPMTGFVMGVLSGGERGLATIECVEP